MRKKQKAGRPPAKDPLVVRHLVRVTEEDDAAAKQDMQRLAELTGVKWDFSMYMRMCLRQMREKLLKETEK